MLTSYRCYIDERIERKEGNDNFTIKPVIPKDIAIWYGSAALIGTIVAWLRIDMPYTPAYLAKKLAILLPYDQGEK